MRRSLVVDFHLHSRFSRAVSHSMTIPNLYVWGRMKGLHILSVSDVTHPIWFSEIESQLVEQNEGVYTLQDSTAIENKYPEYFTHPAEPPVFVLTTELSLMYSEFGEAHRVHIVVCFPSLEVVRTVNKLFISRGFNLISDGRPILGISLRNLCELLFTIDPRIVIIPAHIWTPWFGVFGSKSGYDSLSDAFGEYAEQIFAVESGLSSDPFMNWSIKELETRTIVSFSDAHSLPKIGREATVLTYSSQDIQYEDISYEDIMQGIQKRSKSPLQLDYTIEYYPEEGKYHYTGHRNCKIRYTPEQTQEKGIRCPVCGRDLTVGVLHRIEHLKQADEISVTKSVDSQGVTWMQNSKKGKFVNLVPLLEIISESSGVGIQSKKVKTIYGQLIEQLGPELSILLEVPISTISRVAGERIGHAIYKVRSRDIVIQPGFDGEYGKVTIWPEKSQKSSSQLELI